MKAAEFDYDLPPELIAQTPVARRDDARLLVVHRAARRVEHRRFFDLPEFLRAGDIVFRNTARVRPARIFGQRPAGGQVECLLLRPASPAPVGEATDERWWCLLRPGRKLPAGATFARDGGFVARVLEKSAAAEYLVSFTLAPGHSSVAALAEDQGSVPLPPYIRREADDTRGPVDRERYQTVFADRAHTVAVAAPTAGLHFTPELLARVERAGARFADVVLHVGLGTFRPIETENIADHPMHREAVEIPAATLACLRAPKTGRHFAIGTTTVRSLEHHLRQPAAEPADPAASVHLEADLFIRPPFHFRGVDALVTNFHLPRSTLLCLVAAFLAPGGTTGVAWWREIYAEAIRERYRFLSYGDAMLIL